MQKAIDMNNKGAYLLVNGEYDRAVQILNQVLAIVQNDLTLAENEAQAVDDDDVVMMEQPQENQEEEEEPEQDENDTPAHKNNNECLSPVKTAASRSLSGSDRFFMLNDISHNQDYFMFEDYVDDEDEEFVFREPIFIDDDENDVDHSTLSVNCVFNLALAHHLTALELDDDEQRLRVALRLYEVCYLMQRNSLDQANSNSTASVVKMSLSHTLGLVNNSGQIHKSLHQHKRANRLFQHLLSSLVLVSEMDDDEQNDDEMVCNDIEQLEGLWKTASQLVLTNPEIASAA